MWRTVQKIKLAWTIALIPKILGRYPGIPSKKFNKICVPIMDSWKRLFLGTYEAVCRARKSSDAAGDKYRKQMRIIEKCFAPKDGTPTDDVTCVGMTDVKIQNVQPSLNTDCNNSLKTHSIASGDKHSVNSSSVNLDNVSLKATTAKQVEEKLAQKIEKIEETPLVEAGTSMEGFNDEPKVLGNENNVQRFHISSTKTTEDKQALYDELAKRCLNSPASNIDKYLLEELNKLRLKSYATRDSALPDPQRPQGGTTEKGVQLTSKQSQPSQLDMESLCLVNKVEEGKEIEFETSSVKAHTSGVEIIEKELLQMPAIINPYDRSSFPFYEYSNKDGQEDDSESDTIITTLEETKLENTLEHENQNVDGRVEGIGVSLGVADQVQLPASHPSKEAILFSSDQSSENYPHVQGTFHDSTEQDDVVPNTAISGTFPVPQNINKKTIEPGSTSISAHQDDLQNQKLTVSGTSKDALTRSTSTRPFVKANTNSANLNKLHKPFNTNTQSEYYISDIVFRPQGNVAKSVSNLSTDKTVTTQLEASQYQAAQTQDVPLSELLKKVRERNRLEKKVGQGFVVKASSTPCLPPLDTGKSKGGIGPPPCKPVTKESPPKCPPKKAPACPPPQKKNPCEKFISNVLDNVYFIRMNVDKFNAPVYDIRRYYSTQIALTDEVLGRIENLGKVLKSTDFEYLGQERNYARGFEPWSPIPSWPTLDRKNKRPFVCPKQGCPTKWGPPIPCKEPHCTGFPKRKFSSTSRFEC